MCVQAAAADLGGPVPLSATHNGKRSKRCFFTKQLHSLPQSAERQEKRIKMSLMYKEAACDDSCESETLTESNTHSHRGTSANTNP